MVQSLPHSPPATNLYEQKLHGSWGKGRSKGKDGVGWRCAWDRNHLLAMLGECSALCRDRTTENAKLNRPLSMLPSQEPEEERP